MEIKPQPRPDAIMTVTDDDGTVISEPVFFLSEDAVRRLLEDIAASPDPDDSADDWKRK